ncbi:MAG: GspH/FimT family pseudopilin [Burkholderiaceae bacterium]|nr:GspH/FimT family pseudopilin [Burkholderiaceae bacterium]
MKARRPFIRSGLRCASAGFTLLELMFTVTILGALIVIAVPTFEQMMASRQATSAAQSLAASLRKAQAEATRLNRNVEVLMTSSNPTSANVASAAPTAPSAATAWMVRVQDATSADEFLAGESRERFGAAITTAGNLQSVVFTPMGRVLDLSGGAPVMFATPRIVQFNHAAQSIRFCTYVTPGGSIRVCDSAAAAGTNSACQPRLPTGC